MCVLSAVLDYGQRQRDDWWDQDKLEELKKAIEQAKVFDQKTGQPNCEDPEKLKFLRRIELRVQARKLAEDLFKKGHIRDVESFILGAEWAS